MSASPERIAKLTCAQRDALLGWGRDFNEHFTPWSSLTDLTGEFGEPLVETVWGPRQFDKRFLCVGIHDIRHPSSFADAKDAQPCAHYLVLLDERPDESEAAE